MSAYEATFGSTDCHVRVESRSNGREAPIFAATPFVISHDRNVFNWLPDAAGDPIEFLDRAEAAALARAATFLVDQFGRQNGEFVKAADRSAPVVLKPLARPWV